MKNLYRLLQLAFEKGAVKYGEFTLSSGNKSNYYFDGRLLTLDPEGSYLLGKLLLPIIKRCGAEAIGGPTIGADPLVTAVTLTSYLDGYPIPGFIVRQSTKKHGTAKRIEGPLANGQRVAIVDDVCTTGTALLKAINAAEALDCRVEQVVVILDRHQGGTEELRRRGYNVISLLEATPEGKIEIMSG